MTADERQYLRQLVDQVRRQIIAEQDRRYRAAKGGRVHCGRCGTHLDDRTPGCPACTDRHRNRRRRVEQREWFRVQWRKAREKKRAARPAA